MKLVTAVASLKDKHGQVIDSFDVMPWTRPEEKEATPEDIKRMFGVKSDG